MPMINSSPFRRSRLVLGLAAALAVATTGCGDWPGSEAEALRERLAEREAEHREEIAALEREVAALDARSEEHREALRACTRRLETALARAEAAEVDLRAEMRLVERPNGNAADTGLDASDPTKRTLVRARVSHRVTERNDTWWRHSWTAELSNATDEIVSFQLRIVFLDEMGFPLQQNAAETVRLAPRGTLTKRGFVLIKPAQAQRVAEVQAIMEER
ncbi:MAG: hypothetical protein AAGN46_13560 [Acidobacteriota bacterium]